VREAAAWSHGAVTDDALPAVRYGEASLSDVLPAVLSSLGVPGERNTLGLADSRRTVVLLVDGLGWELLRRHPDAAPFLAALPGRPLTAGFPSTTVSSLASLGTGLPSGEHGLTGYTSYVEEAGGPVGWLGWSLAGTRGDLREQLVPEQVQPQRTAFERAADDGVAVTLAAPAAFRGTGLTRAVLRGGSFAGSHTAGDTVAQAVAGAARGDRSLVYCYTGDLDLVGHVRGTDSEAWRVQLRLVDRLAEELASRLPPGTTLLVTADHGMVDVDDSTRIDLDASPELTAGVLAVAGEPRARHVHTVPAATADVLTTWRAQLGGHAWVGSRQEAVAAGLFGPLVTPTALRRIGDVVAVARGRTALLRPSAEPLLSSLVGQHGALTDDELLVPLLQT